MRVFSSVAALALLSACATTSQSADLADRDPLEGFNRAMWGVNRGADKVVIKPISTVYRTITPRPARRGISRAFSNLSEPWSFVNNLLQGKPKRAVRNLGRFLVNTTIGVGGLADPASDIGIPAAPEDFGQTLAVWGVKDTPYLVLPLLGPSTIRDGIGTGVAFFGDPVNICLNSNGCINASGTERLAITGAEVISARADLTEAGADTLLDGSLDSYATARSAYLQRRQAAIVDEGEAGGRASATSDNSSTSSGDAAMDAAVRELEGGDDGATPADATTTPATPGPAAADPIPNAPSAADPAPATETPPQQ